MVRPNIVLKKIVFIRDHLERVRLQQSGTLEEFLENRDQQDIVCFNLYQAIQACADLAGHVVSDEEWGIPGSYGETIDILVNKKVVSTGQGKTFREMLGFRNRLAHDYAEIDLEKVYQIMTEHLHDLDDFVDAIVTHFHL